MKNQFGTFGGVFTPAILTILGVIMFMRANFVVGEAGVIGAIIILLIAKSITTATSFSIAAISTNMQMRGGGSYFLISRVLGAEFGGAIGIALFFALALSVPFYILGFTEALVRSFPALAPHFMAITLSSAAFLFAVSFYGAGLAIRTQYVIMLFLLLAIIVFLGGAAQHFSIARLMGNLSPDYTPLAGDPSDGPLYSFWTVFAIYFPAVTGIDAGVNMSGDLKDPGRSIPRGTFAAVGIGFLIYLLQIVSAGGAYERRDLIAMPFELLRDNALFGWSVLVTLGVIAATLSSAMGSYLGAPRVLQAVSRDRVLFFLHFFAKGTSRGDEPRRALFLTLAITIAVLLWAGNETSGTALNAVAAIITMFFLYSYGMINLAAFIEDFGDNPSFRPRFRFFHWGIALLGSLGCLAVSILISWGAAAIAVCIILFFLWYIKTQRLKTRFGDARRGFVYNRVRTNLLRLGRMAEDAKNWRPNILVFSGSPTEREDLITYALWIEARRGIVYLAYVLVGEFSELAPRRQAAIRQLDRFCDEQNFDAFPVVVVAPNIGQGMNMMLQSTVTGPIRPNLAMFGWSHVEDNTPSYMAQIRTAAALDMNTVLLETRQFPPPQEPQRIDIWWRGQQNGGLMILIAHLLQENWQWRHAAIRVLRVIENDAGREPALAGLEKLIAVARVGATAQVISSTDAFPDVFHAHSADADIAVLGFEIPENGDELAWHRRFAAMVAKAPNVMLVNSRGGEGLLA